ncbi:hypothetical protein [Burkholderia anthina]|uniref:hypothetical protein n=1 Tax=Burkholderia anthina TaxID=179879 RepID=UPI00158A5A75|nr:hypothetical protein [Burkholderia anthina]
MSTVPLRYRSTTPGRLRELEQSNAHQLRPVVRHALLEAANEIEGGEQAYATLVGEKHVLQAELRASCSNHQHTLGMLARWRELLVAIQAERPDDVRVRRALAGEHPFRPAPWEKKT